MSVVPLRLPWIQGLSSGLVLLILVMLPCGMAWSNEPREAARMLMVTQSAGFKHGSVTRPAGRLAPAERAITELGIATGLFRVDCIQDVSTLTKDMLDNYRLILFYTTGDLPFQDDVRDYLFTEWVKKTGNGFLGAHSAADTYHNYEPYWEMLGGTFNGHPWNAGDTVTIEVHDQEHPASRPWGEQLVIKDEIYQFKNWQPEKVRVLASLDFEHTPLRKPYHVPILWVKEYGDGKVMHMSLGHNEHVWETPAFLEAMAGGVRWMLGLEEADATPNPEVSQAAEQRAKEMFERFSSE